MRTQRPHHKATTYSRVARLLKQRVAEALAPTIAEGLSEGDVQLRLHPPRRRLLVMAGAVGLTVDHTANRASADRPRLARDQEGRS